MFQEKLYNLRKLKYLTALIISRSTIRSREGLGEEVLNVTTDQGNGVEQEIINTVLLDRRVWGGGQNRCHRRSKFVSS